MKINPTFIFSLPLDSIRKFFFYSLLITVSCAILLQFSAPIPATLPIAPFSPISLSIAPNLTDPFILLLRNATTFALTSYLNHCLGSDEVNPLDGSCSETYGFQATLLESIETLRLLRLDSLFNHTLSILKSNFSCERLGFVNRYELWSRAIGSLIGSYFLTGDHFFIDSAEKCASLALVPDRAFKFKSAFVNLKTGNVKRRIWQNGTSLREIGTGLPELLSLYEITSNRTYLWEFTQTTKIITKTRLSLPIVDRYGDRLFNDRSLQKYWAGKLNPRRSGFYALTECIPPFAVSTAIRVVSHPKREGRSHAMLSTPCSISLPGISFQITLINLVIVGAVSLRRAIANGSRTLAG
jgi:hypothetical protein